MVSALVSRSSGPGSSPGWGHCVVLAIKTLLSLCFTQVFKWVILGVAVRGTSIPTRGRVEILLVSLCKLRLDWPVGSYVIYSQKCHL